MSASTTVRRPAERLVVAGTMGPTIHDVHAWRFRTAPGLIEVHADPARFRAMHDPLGRGLHLGCGAALVNLRLAAAQFGQATVVRLLPYPEQPTVLAAVRLAGRHRVTRAERLLYATTLRPFPGRGAGPSVKPSLPVLNELGEAARLEGVTLHALPGDGVQRAMLTTRGDDPATWLRAGQALQRVLLGAAARSVSVSFLYEVVDVPELRDLTGPGDVPQVMLELARLSPARAERRQGERQRHLERVG
ncbi:hypothetical protein [Actinomadura hibisca]|uniref:hypothetical protein n=1 Tax=Actinomadura hibisca TaxID=68565 RepID=UPI00082A5F1A|nr:hypothetical protein [Actinomadura hibisca]